MCVGKNGRCINPSYVFQAKNSNHGKVRLINNPSRECFNFNFISDFREEMIKIMDKIDCNVEALRKEAIKLQGIRDDLQTGIDIIRDMPDLVTDMSETDQESIAIELQRLNDRLQTIHINVVTVRDTAQEETLSLINDIIVDLIVHQDPIAKRHKCETYLNTCSSDNIQCSATLFVDKTFEEHLLRCTLDDQKRIKKRLAALMQYMLSSQQIALSD